MNDQNLSITYENKFTDVLYFALYHYTRSTYMLGLFVVLFFVRNMKLITTAFQEPNLPLSFVAMNLLIDGFIMALLFIVSLPIILFITYYSKKNKSMFTT